GPYSFARGTAMKPHALICLLLVALTADAAPPTSKEITAALEPFVEKDLLAGAVTLVADREKVLSLDAVGFANIAGKVPVKADTLFWIASQTKPITAAALMLLVDEGKVRLDDPVTMYLPEFADQKISVKGDKGSVLQKPKVVMTVRHLLNHTSGMPFRSAK